MHKKNRYKWNQGILLEIKVSKLEKYHVIHTVNLVIKVSNDC